MVLEEDWEGWPLNFCTSNQSNWVIKELKSTLNQTVLFPTFVVMNWSYTFLT